MTDASDARWGKDEIGEHPDLNNPAAGTHRPGEQRDLEPWRSWAVMFANSTAKMPKD